MSSVISRNTLTDDTGAGTDGTIWNNAFHQDLFDRIDAMFSAGAASFGGTLACATTFTVTAPAATNAKVKVSAPAGFAASVEFNEASTNIWVIGLNVTGGTKAFEIYNTTNGATMFAMTQVGVATFTNSIAAAGAAFTDDIEVTAAALGAGGVPGRFARIGRNSSSTGAPGCVVFESKAGTPYYVFVEDGGTLRLHTSAPTVASGDGIGDIVGTQT